MHSVLSKDQIGQKLKKQPCKEWWRKAISGTSSIAWLIIVNRDVRS